MTEELQDEMGAIEAIYPECFTELAPLIYKFKIPQHEHITVQMSFPEKYPDEKPNILDVLSTKKGYDEEYLTSLFQEVLDSIYSQGDVCVFDFFTELDAVLFEDGDNDEQEEIQGESEYNHEDHWHASDSNAANISDLTNSVGDVSINDKEEIEDLSINRREEDDIEEEFDENGNYIYDESKQKAFDKKQKGKDKNKKSEDSDSNPLSGWSISDPITDRKSTFVAFAREVHSVEEAESWVDTLRTDRKIARAAHCMTAWRIKMDNGIQFQDCDDDGETAAGGRLLHLLTIMDAWNCMVLVARFFGGVHIGPDRFKHINSTAREAVVKGGFVEDKSASSNNSKKSKKKK